MGLGRHVGKKPQNRDRLLQVLVSFVQAQTWAESQRMLAQHPELLSVEADALLGQLAQAQRDQAARQAVQQSRALLRRCREVGIEAAIAERAGDQAPRTEPLHVPSEFQPAVQRASQAMARYRQTGDAESLSQSIAAWQTILSHSAFAAAPERFRLAAMHGAGGAFLRRYWTAGQVDDLDTALALYQQAVTLMPLTSPDRAALLNNLGAGLRDRYARTGDLADLEQAISVLRQAVSLTPPTSSDRASRLTNLGASLNDRYARTGDLADLEQAIGLFRQASSLTPPTSPDRAGYLNNLGAGLSNRYVRTGDLADLEQAIAVLQQAVSLTPPTSLDRARYLNNLGTGLGARYAHTGDLADLEQAIGVLQQAVSLTPPTSPDRAMCLNNLGAGLRDRYARMGNLADLEQAIGVHRQAVTLTPPASPDRAGYLNNLGIGLRDRYARMGDLSDLEQAIDVHRQAVTGALPTSPDGAAFLTNLGNGLRDRYARTGDLASLEQAIGALQQAVTSTPPESPDRASRLNNLGAGLRDRYTRTGDLADLDQAIGVYQQAVSLTPPESPDRAGHLTNLGAGLRDRYARAGAPADLEQAIDVLQQAATSTPPESPDHAEYLTNLGAGLRDRYARTRDLADLEQAIAVFQQAATSTPPESPGRAMCLTNLGNGLLDRYTCTGDLSDLDQAIGVLQQAVDITPPASPDRASRLNNLGNGLSDRYAGTENLADLEQAIGAYRQACESGLASHPEAVLVSSRTWGRWALARGAWDEAAQALLYGAQGIERLVRTQLARGGKEAWLREAQALPASLAFALARRGDSRAAVESLESGRARLLAEAMERSRADLEQLPALGQAELYERYRQASEGLQHLESIGQQPESIPSGMDLTAELRAARAELDTAIEAIRQAPGYADLFQSPSFEETQRALLPDAAESAAAVYVLVTPVGGLALIVRRSGVEPVWLDFTEADANSLLGQREGESVTGGYLLAQLGKASLDESLEQVLPALGEKVMRPVAEALRARGVSSVVLIPCGRLALFPLHAARYRVNESARCFMDEFTVTFTPSAQALGHCRDILEALPVEQPRLLGVGNPLPLPEGARPLEFARPEVEEIVKLFKRATVLYETDATRPAVENGLGAATCLHLSCHGRFNAQDPLSSGVVLSQGEMITLRDLIARPLLKGTRLAVLSACQTAITDFNTLPEEAIGLPAGFLQAGVPGVVGSLWPVNDLSTALLMIKFYEYHLRGDSRKGERPMPPASALRKAQLWLRDVTNAELAELFDMYRQAAPDSPTRMAFATAQQNFEIHSRGEPDERPFAHPYYWAAFAFYGA